MTRTTTAIVALAALFCGSCASPAGNRFSKVALELQAIEAASGGRLGAAVADSKGRIVTGHRSAERFALCSTFKLLLAGMILHRARQGELSLDDRLPLSAGDLVFHSPVTELRAKAGSIAVADAARAIVTVSDNTAANLLRGRMGGPAAFTAWLRDLGDESTRLDRFETALNSNHPSDPRDTTTPAAIARSSAKLVFGSALEPSDRETLRTWLIESETGRGRIRAGLPTGFTAGDKTGTCGAKGRESYNDVAFILPHKSPDGHGHIVAAYLDRPAVGPEAANALLAQIGRNVAAPLHKRRSAPAR